MSSPNLLKRHTLGFLSLTPFIHRSLLLALAAITAGAVTFSWQAKYSSSEAVTVFPDVPFQWTVTAKGTEDYHTSEAVSDSVSVTVKSAFNSTVSDSKGFTAKATGNATLSYSVFGQNILNGHIAVTVSVTPDGQGTIYNQSFNTQTSGNVPIPLLENQHYTLAVSSASFGSFISLNDNTATVSYQLTHNVNHTTPASATAQGISAVNAFVGPKTIPFQAVPSPANGGTIRDITYAIDVSDLRVKTLLSGTNAFIASTDWQQQTITLKTNVTTGTFQITVVDGPKQIATLPQADAYQLSGSFPSDYLTLWTQGGALWGQLIKNPLSQEVRLKSALRDDSGIHFEWASVSGVTYEIQWLPDFAPGNSWNLIGRVAATNALTTFVDSSALSKLSSGFYQIIVNQQ